MKYRDALIIKLNNNSIVITADNSVSIGHQANDQVKADPELVGALTARVALFEAITLGATPQAVSCTLSFPFNSDNAQLILGGIKREAALYGVLNENITGSCEKNFPASVTAIGVTVISNLPTNALINRLQDNDNVFVIGVPRVGLEVVNNINLLPTYETVQKLLDMSDIHEIIPCGSGGISSELNQLLKTTSFKITKQETELSLTKSAGPASCLIAIGNTTKEQLKAVLNCEINHIGSIRR